MRFAGQIEYKVSDNAEIEAALAKATALIVESIPTSEGKPWNLVVMFEATQ